MVGLILGSFISLLTYRLPKKIDIFIKRSRCTACSKNINWTGLFPILSFMWQKGRCANCGIRISFRYPIIEAFSAIIIYISYNFYPEHSVLMAIIYLTLFSMIVTDLETLSVPDLLQIIFAVCGTYYVYSMDLSQEEIITRLVTVIVTYLIINFIIFIYYKYRRRIAMGGADVKFIVIAALYFDLFQFSNFLFLSGLIGVLFGIIVQVIVKKRRFPFIPCSAMSFVIILNKLTFNIFLYNQYG